MVTFDCSKSLNQSVCSIAIPTVYSIHITCASLWGSRTGCWQGPWTRNWMPSKTMLLEDIYVNCISPVQTQAHKAADWNKRILDNFTQNSKVFLTRTEKFWWSYGSDWNRHKSSSDSRSMLSGMAIWISIGLSWHKVVFNLGRLTDKNLNFSVFISSV